jgi:hypothetical protein
MSLTPEQFNKIALKEDLKKIASKDDLKEMKNEILSAIDGLAKSVKDMKVEQAANIGAHDRMQAEINGIKTHVGMEVGAKAIM